MTTGDLDALLSIAVDLTAGLSADDRYQRLLGAVRRLVPCDAAALLCVDGDGLRLLAAHGLSPDAMGRRFALAEHPRLAAICGATEPVRFPPASDLPDPFDGLLAADPSARVHVHACLGCPLRVEGELVGALTADALEARAFERLDPFILRALGALAGAAVRTTRLIEALQESAARQGLIARDLMRDAAARQGGELTGDSPEMQRVRREIEVAGPSDLPVLVTGETGVGKELVVRALHAASRRRDEPLSWVNCAALPEALVESELFGHVRGSFTGAVADRPGKLEVASGGTLFLDEIGELPLAVQPKLLRALQQGEIQRVGSDRALRVDVRVLAATNRDLAAEVRAGRFRADLYHRLAVYPIAVPPLRERLADVPALAGRFCEQLRQRLGVGPVRLRADALAALRRYPWPGNVRELENVLSRAVVRAAARAPRGEPVVLTAEALGPDFAVPAAGAAADAVAAAAAPASRGRGAARTAEPASTAGLPLREAVDAFEAGLIRAAVDRAGGNWAAAARELGVDRGNLHRMAQRLGLLEPAPPPLPPPPRAAAQRRRR